MPKITIVAAAMTNATAATRNFRRAGGAGTDKGSGEVSGDMLGSSDNGGHDSAFAFMQHTEDDRHEHQGCHRRENETADDSPPKRRVLFAAFAQAKRHRGHADDH